MKKLLRVLAWILLAAVALAAVAWFGFLRPKPPPVSDKDRSRVQLVPLPASLNLRQGNLILESMPQPVFRGAVTPRMERATERFSDFLAEKCGFSGDGNSPVTLILKCGKSSPDYPRKVNNEAYSIRISAKGILLEAPEEWGILHGLETLRQLLQMESGQWSFPRLRLEDRPRYPWRGLMIDACRHWIPKEVIMRNLDGMAAVKLNVLHWHLSDYQAFRVESVRFPLLHEMGSGGKYYSREDVREVIAYAADRGIRVVPEFDLPGHSTSWFAGYPWLASAPGPYTPDTVFGVLEPVMDPTREEVYGFLDTFFGEMAGLFPDPFIHIGGDEVATSQWDNNQAIQRFMKENNLADAHALQATFNRRLHGILRSHQRQMMGWDEIIHPDLPVEGTAVQAWRNHTSLWEAARAGYGAVLSSGYYLDHKRPAGFHYRVDPEVIPGAVDIEIDTALWKSWDITLRMNDLRVDGALYLFGSGEQLRGILSFMGIPAGFEKASLNGNQLTFTFKSDYGNSTVESTLEGDSIYGTTNISMFKLQLTGNRSGGSDMEHGNPLPEFKRLEPLTDLQKKNILGGEACMWSEMVNEQTMESRIWPRAAAVAEKLWSPAVLTGDEKDMYRRMMWLDGELDERGIRHHAYRENLLRRWVDEPWLAPVRTLVELLQEDLLFNRMVLYDPELYTHTPLDRVVDAAPPESYDAYRFGEGVDRWLESGDKQVRMQLETTLKTWSELGDRLAPVLDSIPGLREAEPHASNLSEIARWGLKALNGELSKEDGSLTTPVFLEAGKAYGGTLLAAADPVKKLVESALPK